MVRIMGLDLGKHTGWSFFERNVLKDYGDIIVKREPIEFLTTLKGLVKKIQPQIVVIENIYNRNVKTFRSLAIRIGWAMAIVTLENPATQIIFLYPSFVRRILGIRGENIKEEVCKFVNRKYRLNLTFDPNTTDHDKADAIALVLAFLKEKHDIKK